MAKYIEREALINAIATSTEPFTTGLVFRAINNQPAADVAPVRRGHWIPIYASELTGWNPEFAGCDPIAGYKCSRCGNEAIFNCNDVFVLSNYCPNCGAKMDKEEESCKINLSST